MRPAVQDRLTVVASALSDDPRQAPRLARLAGFRGLLYEAFWRSVEIPDLSATGRREFRRLLESQQQALVGLRCDLGPKGLGPGADVDRLLRQLDRVLEAAAGLEAPLVCVDLGPLPPPASAPKPKPKVEPQAAGLIILPTAREIAAAGNASAPQEPPPAPPDPAFSSQVHAALVELGKRADLYRTMVAFSSALAGFAALQQALAGADCPWFGVDLDPVALLRDESPADEVFTAVGPFIRHVRARDAVVGADRRTRPAAIGRGDTDWAQLLSLLDEAGYHGYLTIDPTELPDRSAAASAGRAYLAKV